ncbi:hypothetical protein DVH05_017945 [Phytophthora capsici]|nr:hypothetical protein DVH05_017945 [Phytophthora capsici]
MNRKRFLLLEVVLLLFSCIIFTSDADPNHISADNNGKILRGTDLSTEEERGLWTELKSGVKTAWWSRSGKSDAYVKETEANGTGRRCNEVQQELPHLPSLSLQGRRIEAGQVGV